MVFQVVSGCEQVIHGDARRRGRISRRQLGLLPTRGCSWAHIAVMDLPPSPVFPSLASQAARPCCISSRCCRSSRPTSSTLGLLLCGFHGGCSHQASPLSCSSCSCNSRSAVNVTNCVCVVRSIGLRVHPRHSSQPNRCFRSRKASSW